MARGCTVSTKRPVVVTIPVQTAFFLHLGAGLYSISLPLDNSHSIPPLLRTLLGSKVLMWVEALSITWFRLASGMSGLQFV